ncbi:efflux RND transporter permease subunit [Persicimonas caeni]|uniref:Efflux RND transporter permease subunit n=1 Tax=Persicimonas caeni TaxID=2292766 RepID=A0A4Y6PU04_PERCE|nr:efflux RND transporter permease subunit [Persicimonas caeni]QDG51814.1 efflux RND transporter permease subunit [Persicimonas caeni]QED33035.1 efflux RND transporter permease subunit [Persicimonas caeni]
MNLPKAAVHRPVLTTMFFLGLIFLGAVSFTRLQVDLLPEIDFPSISVVTTYEGAGPEEMETIVTRPIEQAVSTIEGIDRIESLSAEGRSRVALRFVWGTNLDTALNDVRAAVERVKSQLPEEAENPVVYKFDLGSFPVLYMGLSGELDEPALRQLAEQELGPRIERIEGVARVDVRGGLKRQIHILLDAERLKALDLAPQTVVSALREQNRNVPAGVVEQFDDNVLLRSVGEAEKVEDFESVVVDLRTGEDGSQNPIFLKDVARIVDTYEEPTNVVRVNGEPGIRLSVNKQSGSNTVTVAKRVIAELDGINRDYEGRAKLTVLEDTSEYIEDSISNVQESVLIGALLAIFVLLFFLRDVRSTLIIATAIPISVIGIFTLMYYFDITLNLISFGGVALGIGLLVDNAIVILENIFRKLEEGDDPETAAVDGSREVATAIVASTTTTLVVFIPVVFLTGLASIFFGQMAFVVSFALICALAVALTLVPMLSAKFLSTKSSKMTSDEGLVGSFLAALERTYGNLADWCLSHPKITLTGAAALLGASLLLVPHIGTELMPEEDQSEVNISLDMPVGTRIEVTERAIRKIEAVVPEAIPEMESMRTIIGTPGFWSSSGEESASIEIKVVDPEQRDRSSEEIANDIRSMVTGLTPGADVRVRAGGGLWILRIMRGGGDRLQLQVRGFDMDTGDKLALEVKEMMESTEGIASARISRQPGGKELQIVPDRKKLGRLGVTPAVVARQIQTYVQGSRATVFRALGDEFDVLVRLSEKDRESIEAVLDAPVVLPGVGSLPMREVVEVRETESPLTIDRENQRRVIDLRANLTGDRDLGSLTTELRDKIRQMEMPEGFSVLVKGESEEQKKTFSSLLVGILLAIVLVYMVMASQFESFLQPLYIMFSIPFAAIGVLAMLAATGTTFNMQSFLGCIVLIGIVVNNAIVLIDYINLMREERSMSVLEAVRVSVRRRLRPILMTTATTMLALMPVAIGLGEGGETQAPLARAVIGGLFVSAAISLVVIPVIYNWVEGWREKRARSQA